MIHIQYTYTVHSSSYILYYKVDIHEGLCFVKHFKVISVRVFTINNLVLCITRASASWTLCFSGDPSILFLWWILLNIMFLFFGEIKWRWWCLAFQALYWTRFISHWRANKPTTVRVLRGKAGFRTCIPPRCCQPLARSLTIWLRN